MERNAIASAMMMKRTGPGSVRASRGAMIGRERAISRRGAGAATPTSVV
jgi:hypothetical protein